MSKELIFSARRKDFTMETFRCGGPGGQNQNKRDTGVRLTHKETGISAESREHRTQAQNKKAAFNKLVDKLVSKVLAEQHPEIGVKSSVTVRTYNKPDDRVVDHVTKKKYSYKETVDKGELAKVIEDRREALSSNEEN